MSSSFAIISFAIIIVMLAPGAVASAAPTIEGCVLTTSVALEAAPADEATPDDEATPEGESASELELKKQREVELLMRARELFGQGQAKFEVGDHPGAIESWQEAYDLLPLCKRSQLFAPLGSAYWSAYHGSGNEEHLQRAKTMYTYNLDSIGVNNQQARADTQAQLAEIEAELRRREAERLEQARRKAAAEALAAERARQQQREQAERKARAQAERRRFRLSMILGGSSAGLGVVSLSMMTAGLALGARVERDGETLALDPNPRRHELRDLIGPGTTYNRLAWASGAAGGVLVVSGLTVMVVSLVQHRRFETRTQERVTASVRGLEVRF
ncbi:MAG: hypothetical protein AAGF11_18325 [Myxococcota bacterium]